MQYLCALSILTIVLHTLSCVWGRVEWKRQSMFSKLIRLDRPPAKIWSKSDSNRLLINFYDPISAVRSIVATILIRNSDHYIESSLILIKKSLIYIENYDLYQKDILNDDFRVDDRDFDIKSIYFWYIIDINRSFSI